MAKTYKIKVKFVFEGEVEVFADSKAEAKEIVEKDFGLVLGRDLETSSEAVNDWTFNIHPVKIVK